MSISGLYGSNTSNNNMNNMSRHSFFEFRKQASFYIKEKIKTARLALTDVTPTQLLTEEATNANPWAPDTRTLGLISRAAFEVNDYWRIVDILHNKLSNFDKKNWRASYNALIVLEHLLTHGPESVAEEFQREKLIITDMKCFQHVDERGFNWGLAVRKKSERLLKLLEKGPLLKEERNNARKLSREIKGFGSFSGRATSVVEESSTTFGRSHSQFNEHGNELKLKESKDRDQSPLIYLDDDVKPDKSANIISSLKENMKPRNGTISIGDNHLWSNHVGEENALLRNENNDGLFIEEEDHPFSKAEKHSRVSLLAAADED